MKSRYVIKWILGELPEFWIPAQSDSYHLCAVFKLSLSVRIVETYCLDIYIYLVV